MSGSSPNRFARTNTVNTLHKPVQFTLDKSSYEATKEQMALTGGKPVVDFSPPRATIPPRSSVGIEAIFAPFCEQAHNFNVLCKVRG